MKCPSCTKEIKPDLKFCPHCGMRIVLAPPPGEGGKKKKVRFRESPAESAAKWKMFIGIIVVLFGGYFLYAMYEAYSIQRNFKLCQYHRRTGNYFRASGICEKVVARRPRKTEAWVELARCYRGAGDIEKTLKAVSDALKWGPDAELYAIQGEQLYLDNKPVPAAKALDKALSMDDENNLANFYRGLIHLDAGEYRNAAGRLEKALKKASRKQKLEINENLGDIHSKSGDTDKAINAYIAARQIDMNDIRVCMKLAQAYVSDGDAEKALQESTRCVEISPEDAEARKLKAAVFAQKEKIDAVRYVVARRKLDESLQMLYASLTSMIDRFNADPAAFVGQDNIELSEIHKGIEEMGAAYRKLAPPDSYHVSHTLTLRAITTLSDTAGYLGRFMKSGEEQHYATLAEYMKELEKVMSQLVTLWKNEERNVDIMAVLREAAAAVGATSAAQLKNAAEPPVETGENATPPSPKKNR